MTDGVKRGWTYEWICHGSHTVVVLTQMVRDVQCWNRAHGEELLCHARVIHLVDHQVESMYLGKCVHLKLASPSGIFSDPAYVVLNFLVILYEKLVQLLVFFDMVSTLGSELSVVSLIAFKLVTESTK